jgi:hypothetical protein
MKYVTFGSEDDVAKVRAPVMPPKCPHSTPTTPPSGSNDHRIVSFRPRRATINETTRPHRSPHHRDPGISLILSLVKFEFDGREDHYQHRMIMNGLAFVVLLALVTIGIWLAVNINDRHHTLRGYNVETALDSGHALGNPG